MKRDLLMNKKIAFIKNAENKGDKKSKTSQISCRMRVLGHPLTLESNIESLSIIDTWEK